MTIYPHIMLQIGDKIKIPRSVVEYVTVFGFIEGRLLCIDTVNVFTAPRGFFTKDDKGFYIPIIDKDE